MAQSLEVSASSLEQPLVPEPARGGNSESPPEVNDAEDFDEEFEMIGADVILGDGTCCTLDFTESAYAKRLLSEKERVKLDFGSKAAVEELRRIVALNMRRRTPPSDVSRSVGDSDVVPKRELLIKVVELCARLEMEETFGFLCNEFGRIYRMEVGRVGDVNLPWLAARNVWKLSEVLDFRRKVKVAFKVDDEGAVAHLQPLCSGEVQAANRVEWPGDTSSFVVRLKNDCYFRPAFYEIRDIMQSIGSASTTVAEALYLGEDFVNKSTLLQNRSWEGDDMVKECADCSRSFSSWTLARFGGIKARNCRCCGRRLCERCTAWMLDKSLAKLSKPGEPEEGRMRPACCSCFNQATEINKHAFLCPTFVKAGLSIVDIALLRTVNEQWMSASELCLSDYRSSLYENVWNSRIPERTAQILANSADLLVGHPEPLIFLFISMDWQNGELVDKACQAMEETARCGAPTSTPADLRNFSWKPRLSHWYMLCTRTCGRMLPPFFGIKILECLHRAPEYHPRAGKLRQIVAESLLLNWIPSLDTCIRECVVLLLLDIYYLESCQPQVTSALLALSKLDLQLAITICQEATARMEDNKLSYSMLRRRVVDATKEASPELHEMFLNTLEFLRMITPKSSHDAAGGDAEEYQEAFVAQLSRSKLRENWTPVGAETTTSYLPVPSRVADECDGRHAISPMLFPFDSNVVITQIHVRGIRVVKSCQRPVLIPLIDNSGNTRCILVKGGTLERDKVMCTASRFLQWVLYRQMGGVVLPTYHVILLSPSSGVIEVVMDGQTIHDVIEKDEEGRLLRYLELLEEAQNDRWNIKSQFQRQDLEKDTTTGHGLSSGIEKGDHDAERPTSLVCKNFMCSAKFFILLNYVFAIGDRHRENFMIHTSGAIFHIDYGMVLKTRTLAEHIVPFRVRFDPDLEECIKYFMGRAGSSGHSASEDDPCVRFINETADWFLEVRSYAGVMHQLLSHIVRRRAHEDIRDPGRLTAVMNVTLMRNLAEASCKESFFKHVNDSRGQTWLKDITHDTHKRTQKMWDTFSNGYTSVRTQASEVWKYITQRDGLEPSRS